MKQKIKGIEVILFFLIIGLFLSTAYAIFNYFPVKYPHSKETPVTEIPFRSHDAKTLIYNHDMQRSRAFIEKQLPGLKDADEYHKAVMLRDFVYKNIKIGSWKYESITYQILLGYLTREKPVLCYGASYVYIALLELYGIPARLVSIETYQSFLTAKPGQDRFDTHTTVEAYTNGHWYLQDPTFNIHWDLGRKILSTLELANAFDQGLAPSPNTDGYSLIVGRRLQDYYLTYRQLLEQIIITRTFPWSNKSYVEMNPVIHGNVFYSYDFNQGMSNEWTISSPNSAVFPFKQVSIAPRIVPTSITGVQTCCKPYEYVLNTIHPLFLQSGMYQMVVDGVIESGGMGFGIVNDKGEWLSNAAYAKDDYNGWALFVQYFNITIPGEYNFILYNNNSQKGNESKWGISNIRIIQQRV